MCIPKGVPEDKIAVVLALMSFMLKPEQQAVTYDKGYFYPGPAVKGVTLAMAPEESRNILKEFGRPAYDDLIAKLPTEAPLTPERLVAAFRRWDQEIGSKAK
jgi:putative spermidine/putrescine transport system substrate-binding protein